MIDGNMECEALLALIPKPKRSSTRRRKATTDNEEVNAGEILALLPVAKKRKTWLKHVRSNGRRDQMTGAMQQQLLAARRYNNSGQAVRHDSLITTDTCNAPLRGKSRWRNWLPEAILRAAFSSVSNRAFAKNARHNHSTTALGKVNHSTVSHCKKASASAIMAGQEKGLERIWEASLSSALNFWITSHVADETKLWYIVPGHGYRKYSTLSHHSQVTWQLQEDGPIFDEDVFRTPEAMKHYSAAVQYHILSADGCAGVNPQLGLRPQARFYGVNIVWDSHRVNKLEFTFR